MDKIYKQKLEGKDSMDSASTSYTALGGAKKNAKKIPAEEAAAKHKSLFRRNVLLLIVSIVDVVVSFGTFCEWNGLYFWKRVVELPSQSFFLGWSSVDLWIVTLVKVIFIYWTFGRPAVFPRRPPLTLTSARCHLGISSGVPDA